MLFVGTMENKDQTWLALVVQIIGMDTRFGRIQRGLMESQAPKMPLAIKLDEFGETMTVIISRSRSLALAASASARRLNSRSRALVIPFFTTLLISLN